jgi:hypothetical protein
MMLLNRVERRSAIGRCHHLVSVARQQLLIQRLDARRIVGHEHTCPP